ncbi:protein NRT1/ PTR FAMILY 5.6-like protein [Cinnamomum micranthum f. kanehirae]|uniref:Protein NRT1/ PTR FAMILY 5.6-like protein n=1 Tax=Cinnamomum micranthum f. kanehirae TaxID=337451 RepID=A0A443P5V1_9MAGN|nr:protein NRT1/ PTR FAMILY 5.6-like protein [Cinnamomum micranthum f. kanehirae]
MRNRTKKWIDCSYGQIAMAKTPPTYRGQSTRNRNPWRLSTVTEVESIKLVINMVPVWLTSLPIGLCIAQSTTFFIKQASEMNYRVSHNFEIPPASVSTLSSLSLMTSTLLLYDRFFVPMLGQVTGIEGHI